MPHPQGDALSAPAEGNEGERRPPTGLLTACLLPVLRLYRYCLSPLLPNSCRFHPSCSQYAEQALLRHGALGGSWLAVKRILRCHPWHPGGHDPVPEKPQHAGER